MLRGTLPGGPTPPESRSGAGATTAKTAPAGSCSTAMRPTVGMSKAARHTRPPATDRIDRETGEIVDLDYADYH